MGTPQPAPERENLAGLVERVTFHNEERLLRFASIGTRPARSDHRRRPCRGDRRRRVRPGKRPVGQRPDARRAVPSRFPACGTADHRRGIEKYLASGMIKGIGPISGAAAGGDRAAEDARRRSSRVCADRPANGRWGWR